MYINMYINKTYCVLCFCLVAAAHAHVCPRVRTQLVSQGHYGASNPKFGQLDTRHPRNNHETSGEDGVSKF